ncbi:hypothetical protein [Albidovulum sp.]|nr:hypothetical protein [Defluviimonas sp.]
MSEFERRYAKLNPEQKKAVDHIEGPLLVVAGPGVFDAVAALAKAAYQG